MKFKVLAKSYLFGELVEEGAVFDYPDDKLPRDADGSVKFDKLPQLEPIEKSAKPEAKSDGIGFTDEQKAEEIKAAVSSLDKAVDAHWTKTGLPNMDAVNDILGYNVTRKDIEAVCPDFLRPAE